MTCRMRHVLALLLSTALPAFAAAPALAAEPAASAPVDSGAEIAALYRSGDYEEALAKSQARLAALRADKAQTVKLPSALSTHGAILIELERYAEAETVLKEAVALGGKVLGRNDPTTLNALGNLAACYRRQEKNALALPIYEDVVARREAALGKDELLDWQRYDATLVQNVIDLDGLRVDLGQGARAQADLEARWSALNSALDDNALRADVLDLAHEIYADQNRLADLAEPAASFVSRSAAVSSLARHPYTADKTDLPDLDVDDDVERQKSWLRVAYLYAGKDKEARDVLLTMPGELYAQYTGAKRDGTGRAALADYDEAVARLEKSGGYSDPEIYRDILLDQEYALGDAGRPAEIPRNLERQARLAEVRFGQSSPRAAEAWDKLAKTLTEQGRAPDAEVARFRAAAARGERDPELGNNIELAIARKLVAAGRDADAEAIYRREMECGFGPGFDGDANRAAPCDSAMLAMHEYAALLQRRGNKADAEFFRLPHEIVTEYKARQEKSAKDKSERLLVLAGKRYKPDDRYYRMAMGIFDGVHHWYDLPLYDIPRAMRLCGRWDEPEPVRPAAVPIGVAPPVVSVAAPNNYFFFNTGYLSPQDPRRIFYHSITNKAGMSFAAYMDQCLTVGNVDGAVRFGAWADGMAEKMGYPIDDRYDLLLPLARAQRLAGDFAGAERSYQALVSRYLRTDASPPPFGGEKIFVELIQFYGFTGRSEKLQALVLQMLASKEFASTEAQAELHKLQFDLYLGSNAFDDAERTLRSLSFSDFSEVQRGRAENPSPSEQFIARAFGRTMYLTKYATLMLAKGDEAEAMRAIDFGIAENRKDREATMSALKEGEEQSFEQLLTSVPDGLLLMIKAGALGKKGDARGALALFEQSKVLTFYDALFAEIVPASGAFSESDRREMQDTTSTMGALLPGMRFLYSALAQLALNAGETEKAGAWFDKAEALPGSSGEPNVLDQTLDGVAVALAIVDPARRENVYFHSERLGSSLEQLWALGSQSGLDSEYKRQAIRLAPQYYGDVTALMWRLKQSGTPFIENENAFMPVQRATMDVVDLTIAAQTGRAVLAQQRPDLLPLLDERSQLAQAILPAAQGAGSATASDLMTEGSGKGSAEIDARLDRLAEIDATLAKEAPQYVELTSTLPIPLADAQKLLGPDEAILMVAPGTYGTQVMLVTADSLDWQEAPLTLVQAQAAVKRLRWFLGGDVSATAEEQAEWTKAVRGGRNGFDRATAYDLYEKFVVPFTARLQGRTKLFVAAGGPFTALPFSVLVTDTPSGDDDDPEALRKTAWLADKYALVQIPSIQSLALLRKYGPVAAGPKESAFMGFGAPELTGPPAPRGARGGPAVSEVGAVYSGTGAAVVDVEKLRKLAALPGTSEELTSIASALSASDSALALGPAATETRVKQADLRSPAILAFATHALTAGQSFGARQPGLVLTPPAAGTAMDDGLLTAPEIAGLKIGADWVILSACNTAAPDGQGSPGLSGLARSFFEAGARGLLVSHWPVRDDVAAKLTVRTVEARRDNPDLTRAEALQRAMREIRMNRSHDGLVTDEKGQAIQQSWAHPNAWAPFSLIGDGR